MSTLEQAWHGKTVIATDMGDLDPTQGYGVERAGKGIKDAIREADPEAIVGSASRALLYLAAVVRTIDVGAGQKVFDAYRIINHISTNETEIARRWEHTTRPTTYNVAKFAGKFPIIKLNVADQDLWRLHYKVKQGDKNPVSTYLQIHSTQAQRLTQSDEWIRVGSIFDTEQQALTNGTRDMQNYLRVHPDKQMRLIAVLQWVFPPLVANQEPVTEFEWQPVFAVAG